MRLRAIIAASFFAVLVIGLSGSSASAETNTNADASQTAASHNVTVQPGDSLTKLGAANSTTYVRLYNANTQINDPNLIFAGEDLRIPDPKRTACRSSSA